MFIQNILLRVADDSIKIFNLLVGNVVIILPGVYSTNGNGPKLIITWNTIDIPVLGGKILFVAFCFFKIVLIDKVCPE